MKRKLLKLSALLLTLIGFGFVCIPFLYSLSPSAKAQNESVDLIVIPELKLGEPYLVKTKGAKLFILKPSKEQIMHLSELNAHVWDTNSKAFVKELNAYVYWGVSTRRRCSLNHYTIGNSVLTEYDPKTNWLGGYWDTACESSYDYAGRAIKTWEYAYNGFTFEVPNLETPEVFIRRGNKYAVSVYPR